MAEAVRPPWVKLICGMISADTSLFDEMAGLLSRLFGEVDAASDVMDFDFTHYYDEQMGSPLYRKFVSFTELVTPEAVVDAKLLTNAMEADAADRLAGDGPPRPVNLDPGYIAPEKLVLVSMKNFSHRIYVAKSVFAEVTLMYRKGRWETLPWTFPDYASPRYHPFLTAARQRLREQLAGKEEP